MQELPFSVNILAGELCNGRWYPCAVHNGRVMYFRRHPSQWTELEDRIVWEDRKGERFRHDGYAYECEGRKNTPKWTIVCNGHHRYFNEQNTWYPPEKGWSARAGHATSSPQLERAKVPEIVRNELKIVSIDHGDNCGVTGDWYFDGWHNDRAMYKRVGDANSSTSKPDRLVWEDRTSNSFDHDGHAYEHEGRKNTPKWTIVAGGHHRYFNEQDDQYPPLLGWIPRPSYAKSCIWLKYPEDIEASKQKKRAEIEMGLTQGRSFWFVDADFFRNSRNPQFVRHQDFWRYGKFLRSTTIESQHCCHFQLPRHVAVSYVWIDGKHPDPQGEQAKVLRDWLLQNAYVTDVWIDWCCLPQQPRQNLQEQNDFSDGLDFVNMVYLSCKVLKIMNKIYVGRFWPQFEAWLSYQAVDPRNQHFMFDGQRSFEVFTCSAAKNREKGLRLKAEIVELGQLPLGQLKEALREFDVLLTNQGDKERQLTKIDELQRGFRQILDRNSNCFPSYGSQSHSSRKGVH